MDLGQRTKLTAESATFKTSVNWNTRLRFCLDWKIAIRTCWRMLISWSARDRSCIPFQSLYHIGKCPDSVSHYTYQATMTMCRWVEWNSSVGPTSFCGMKLSGQIIINYALIPTAVLQWLFQSPSSQLIWALTIIAEEAWRKWGIASRAWKFKILTCANFTGPDEMLIRNDSKEGSIFIVTSQTNQLLEHSR